MIEQSVRAQPRESLVTELGHVIVQESTVDNADTVENVMFVYLAVPTPVLDS
jgi:hypothetical protein